MTIYTREAALELIADTAKEVQTSNEEMLIDMLRAAADEVEQLRRQRQEMLRLWNDREDVRDQLAYENEHLVLHVKDLLAERDALRQQLAETQVPDWIRHVTSITEDES